MSTVMTIVMCSLCSCASYLLGAGIRNSMFANQPWRFLRWDKNILGYRVLPDGYDVQPGDRIMMAVEVDATTSEVIEESYD